MSLVQVALTKISSIGAGYSPSPVAEGELLVTPITLTSSGTAQKPDIIASQDTLAILLAGEEVNPKRAIWSVTNAGTDFIYIIIGRNLTAGSYNTSNADDYGYLRGPGTFWFSVRNEDEEVVIIQAA